ncbi:MAG: hypothetical protein ABEI86_03770 [Halobacteriaceae archaeon]
MSDIDKLQEKITPHWGLDELENVLDPDVEMNSWRTKEKRHLWRDGVIEQGGNTDNLRKILLPVVDWDNGEAAICLWAGQIKKAQELRDNESPYTSAEDIEASLIERIGTPANVEYEYTRSDLAKNIMPIIESAAITQLRPEVWKDDEKALERVEMVCKEYVNDRIGGFTH